VKKIIILVILFSTFTLQAKAYHATVQEMLHKADLVAIGEVVNIEDGEFKISKDNWQTYHQKVTVRIQYTIKGVVHPEITVYGAGSFICAQTYYEKGEMLLSLKKQSGASNHYISANWQMGALPIKDSTLNWFESKDSRFSKGKETDVDSVIVDILGILAEPL